MPESEETTHKLYESMEIHKLFGILAALGLFQHFLWRIQLKCHFMGCLQRPKRSKMTENDIRKIHSLIL